MHVIFGPKKITCHISDTTAKHVIKLPGCPCPGKAKCVCDNKWLYNNVVVAYVISSAIS